MNIYYTTCSSPLGAMHIAATKKGVCAVAWSRKSWERFIAKADRLSKAKIVPDRNKLKTVKTELDGYFGGNIRNFTVPVDLFTATDFERKVLHAAHTVEWGRTTSYSEIALKIGSPAASRAVGNALGKNPIPIIIPCHRVLKSDGTLGGFSGGLDKKKFLLALENIHL